MIDLAKAIASVVKTGKVSFGANSAILAAKNGKAKMIVLASNCPNTIKEQIEYYGGISKIPIIKYQGDTMDMAAVCNKLFVISALTIREAGDSEILKVTKTSQSSKIKGAN